LGPVQDEEADIDAEAELDATRRDMPTIAADRPSNKPFLVFFVFIITVFVFCVSLLYLGLFGIRPYYFSTEVCFI
jgi:hypothetical protein